MSVGLNGIKQHPSEAWTPLLRRIMSRLKRWRLNEGITQEEAAKRIRTSRQAWSFYERMELRPRPKVLKEISRVTKIPLSKNVEDYYG
jgi:transcriptional regulator with XRE-family HTH domain